MTVQFIMTESGEELAVLPKADLDALFETLEDFQDNAAGAAVAAAVARGEMEVFPGELVSALIAGTNPIRVFREHRGMTSAELAERSALTPDRLGQIEGGAKGVTVSEYRDLGAALGIDVELLDWT